MAQDVVLPEVDAISPDQVGWLAKGRLRLAYWPTPVRVITWDVAIGHAAKRPDSEPVDESDP